MTKTETEFRKCGKTIQGTKYIPIELAERLEEILNRKESLIHSLVKDLESLTDEEVQTICERHAGNPVTMAVYVKFLIGMYHTEKSKSAAWRLKFEQLIKHD